MNKTFLNFLDSQKLSRIGIKSESGFYYHKRTKELCWDKDLFLGMAGFENVYVPAYSDRDLMDALPAKIMNKKSDNSYELVITKSLRSENKCGCEYRNVNPSMPSSAQQFGNTEAEAKAEMILFLKKNNHL